MSHKITVICDHGGGGAGLALAAAAGAVLLFGSGAAASIGDGLARVLAVLLMTAIIAAVVLAALGIAVAVVAMRRRRRGAYARAALAPPPRTWRPAALPAPRVARAALPTARSRPAVVISRVPEYAGQRRCPRRNRESALRHIIARPDLSPASDLAAGMLADGVERERRRP